jgi:tRNA (guanine37-N1)-methyltransferase
LRRHLKEILSEILSSDAANAYSSYDIVGDIAIIRLPNMSKEHGTKIAEAIMNIHKNVKTVVAQISAVSGDFRLRKLEYVAGRKSTVTIHRESGCLFRVDIENCYFSPRLFFERTRIAKQVGNEVVVNMFAGVGCFSIISAKHSPVEKVYSIDVNPIAVQYMRENIRINGVYGKVVPLLGDAKVVVEKSLRQSADRVLMPLPDKALEYLPSALSALKKTGGLIHYYDFEHARKDEDVCAKVRSRVLERLRNYDFEIPLSRIVRETGPNWYQVVLDIKINPRK